ncbi:MAG: MATE family efflux transporter [Desulfobacterales bacterium]|jgi:Na+-driven multidrug efflux pump|nr:MATE family efflux transporter [Desulfobacterales bacterium]
MKSIWRSIKSFDWRLWIVLSATLLIPALYQTVRIFFLGDMPADWGVNIASQLAWINLIYEVIQEAFILPLFFLLGQAISNRAELENRTRTGIIVTGGSYLLLSIIIVAFARPLCQFMASDPNTLDATVEYIQLESIASSISIIAKFITVLFVTLKKDKYMYIILVVQTILSVILDTFLISELPFSAKLGVNGIAIANIITSIVLVGLAIAMLYREDIRLFRKKRLEFAWLSNYGKIGLWSGLESLIRNVAFMLMISRLVNVIAEQGNYWVANNFIWTWLLLPATALYDVIKKESAANKNNIRTKTLGYLVLTTIFSIAWLLSIPLWRPFLHYVMNAEAYVTIEYIVLIQSAFYIIYMYNCIFDGTIYGRGKTFYMFIQSVLVNCVYYLIMFILWITGIFIPNLFSISMMFGIGMAIDLIPTIGCYLYLLKKEKISIQWKF